MKLKAFTFYRGKGHGEEAVERMIVSARFSAYEVSKIGVCALTRIQQRHFDRDSRPDLIVNSVHPGFVDTDMVDHIGGVPIEQGYSLLLVYYY